ncbi:MAG: 4Fe-4S binding protein [bacterium]
MAQVEKENCVGCGACVQACPNDAIKIGADGKSEIDQEKCQKCGRCVDICPMSAITTTDEI